MNPKDTYQKYCSGSPLTDEEVNEGVIFFGKLSEDLYRCGPVFLLAGKEALNVCHGLRDYQTARKLK